MSYNILNGMRADYDYLHSQYEKYFNFHDKLEIGHLCFDYTLVLQDTFINSRITTYDNFDEHYLTDFKYFDKWKRRYSKLNSNVNVILNSFQSYRNEKMHYNLIVIDVGSDFDNLTRIFENIFTYDHIFLNLPNSNIEKKRKRKKVLSAIKDVKCEYLKGPWVHIYE